MLIVIPMAGLGTRFSAKGYKEPKPLIDVDKMPMIVRVISNLGKEHEYLFILPPISPTATRIEAKIKFCIDGYGIKYEMAHVSRLTQGPACTLMAAFNSFNISIGTEMICVNCDQIIEDLNIENIRKFARLHNADGVLGAFPSSSPKNSYMALDPNGIVTRLEEKIVISNVATNGLHYWRDAQDACDSIQKMLDAKDTYNGEYYIAPSYNYMIQAGKKVMPFYFNLHHPIGTPEDLERYLEWKSLSSTW